MTFIKTAERVSATTKSDNFIYQRSLFAYQKAAQFVSGKVLEIGTGSGYGIEYIAPKASEFWTLDKNYIDVDYQKYPNTRFIRKKVPLLTNIPNNYFSFVICFQVIEHIEEDGLLLNEIYRVLKPTGKLIISTPNKTMSLSLNPWHVREYNLTEFSYFINTNFKNPIKKGVYGDPTATMYYLKNKSSVNSILKFDVFGLHKKIPRQLLKCPYDLLNRLNRILLLKRNKHLTSKISIHNFRLEDVSEHCYDFFWIAQK